MDLEKYKKSYQEIEAFQQTKNLDYYALAAFNMGTSLQGHPIHADIRQRFIMFLR